MSQEKINLPKNTKRPIRVNPYWLYVVFLFVIFSPFLFQSLFKTQEISWLTFETKMLVSKDVEKIIIVNKEVAKIYIKVDRLADLKYKDLNSSRLGVSSAPHYSLQIGSLESFEHKMEKAQDGFLKDDRIEILYTSRASLINMFSWMLPVLLLILFWIFVFRIQRKGGLGAGTMMNFGKSTAKLASKDLRSKVTFDDVAGLEEAKIEIMEIVDF